MSLLHDIVAPPALFTLGEDQVSIAELLAFVTGIAAVWLTVRERISNFGIGIANSVFFLLVFLDARLYADMWLQVVFIVLGVQGWHAWLRWGPQRSALAVRRASAAYLAVVVAVVVLAAVALTVILRRADDSAPVLDAATTAISLGAQWLLNVKRVENWAFWAVADLVYIPLYASRDLVLTSIVYVVFLALCGLGARDWMRALHSGESDHRGHGGRVAPVTGEPVPAGA